MKKEIVITILAPDDKKIIEFIKKSLGNTRRCYKEIEYEMVIKDTVLKEISTSVRFKQKRTSRDFWENSYTSTDSIESQLELKEHDSEKASKCKVEGKISSSNSSASEKEIRTYWRPSFLKPRKDS